MHGHAWPCAVLRTESVEIDALARLKFLFLFLLLSSLRP